MDHLKELKKIQKKNKQKFVIGDINHQEYKNKQKSIKIEVDALKRDKLDKIWIK